MSSDRGELFAEGIDVAEPCNVVKPCKRGKPRLKEANRLQMMLDSLSYDTMIDPDHEARVIWDYVCRLDLGDFLSQIKAVEDGPGSSAVDPKILLTLWLYAIVDGVGSSRDLAECCQYHTVYRWICGGVRVSYHTLSTFRSHTDKLDGLLTQLIAALMEQGLVKLKSVSQDGTRIRSSAGSDSFHGQKTLEECLKEAEEQLAALSQEGAGVCSSRQQAARLRGARERQERVSRALERLEELKKKKEERAKERGESLSQVGSEEQDKKTQTRSSSTDPESMRMKMADGGTRPAYNVQFATDMESGLVLGLSVSNQGNDKGELTPMQKQLHRRYGQTAKAVTTDSGYVNTEDIIEVTRMGVIPYVAPKKISDPYKPRKGDSDEIARWRERMGSEYAKHLLQKRASCSEWTNAQVKNRGLRQFLVRGLKKVRGVCALHALAQNFMIMKRLKWSPGAVCPSC